MKCWFCGSTLIWNNDFSFEDYCLEGEGIVTVLSCSGCNAFFEGYQEIEIEEEVN